MQSKKNLVTVNHEALNNSAEQVSAATTLFGNMPIKSEVLLAGTKELVIDHLGKFYKLRITSLGKLILTT